jgi:hypothetical protein
MTVPKDSDEVMRFISAFARLKDYCDDLPEELHDLSRTDPGVRQLCTQLYAITCKFRESDVLASVSMSSPTDPAFIKAWRDYESRYETLLFAIVLKHSGGVPIMVPPGGFGPQSDWDLANVAGQLHALSLNAIILIVKLLTEEGKSEIFQDNFEFLFSENRSNEEKPNVDKSWEARNEPNVDKGTEAWDILTDTVGLDVSGVLRRKRLVPFVLVPRRISASHGNQEKVSLITNLQEAQQAFVFGLNGAALALMRSTMEAVLRDHYGAAGNDLDERIGSVRNRLPRDASEAALHRLRRLANQVLHIDNKRQGRGRELTQ